jgi:exosortase K
VSSLSVAVLAPAPDRHERIANLACIACALGLACGLKAFYSRAGFAELDWVLAPTRRLVEWLTGADFQPEPGRGYLCRERCYLIAPACAGVNFLIVAFVSLSCGLVHTRRSLAGRAAWLTVSALAAYGVTLLANAVRIALAMRLYESGATFGPLSAAQLHCALGIATYLAFLYALFAAATRLTGARHELVL